VSARCTIREDDQDCPRPPAYVVVLDACQACLVLRGWPRCAGHPACIEHTAYARADRYDFNYATLPDGTRAELEGPVMPVRVSSREVPA
jgi:hypothetical protein